MLLPSRGKGQIARLQNVTHMTGRKDLGTNPSQQQIRAMRVSEREWADLESLLCYSKSIWILFRPKQIKQECLWSVLVSKTSKGCVIDTCHRGIEKAVGRDVKKTDMLSVLIFASTFIWV